MGLLDDLANTPRRKPSSKRAQQDRAIFSQVRDYHHQRLAERAAETTKDRELRNSVDWGIEFDE